MYSVDLYQRVRRACHVEGMSLREAARVFGLHRETVSKMLRFSVPPGYRRHHPPRRPKLDPFVGIIDRILKEDRSAPRKQRHTAKRIFERLRAEHGFEGGYTIVKDYVRERRRRSREVFVPLAHDPGHAQVDFGEALAVIAGVERKVHFLAMDLPHSDACFVKAYPAETSEAFCDGHNAAFAFFGGVPRSILYDNTTLAVARILGDGTRRRTRIFNELQSHYLFADRFGRPGKGNDKGKVEGLIGLARRNFMVPIPRFESFEALNAHLEARCRDRLVARLRGHGETIGERLERDLRTFLSLPPSPYDACDKRPGRVSSLCLVRYRGNDYSVPVAYGHREVLIRGFVHEVVISCGAEVIARHRRSYEHEDLVFDPLHYLPLIERKIGALDQAAPLKGWELPEAFATLRRLMKARMGPRNHGAAGKREYVQVLRLMETFRPNEVEAGVRDALRLGAIGFDAVKHLVLCRIEHRPPRLDLDVYPYLPRARVATTSARAYMSLLAGP
jgi:transposase